MLGIFSKVIHQNVLRDFLTNHAYVIGFPMLQDVG